MFFYCLGVVDKPNVYVNIQQHCHFIHLWLSFISDCHCFLSISKFTQTNSFFSRQSFRFCIFNCISWVLIEFKKREKTNQLFLSFVCYVVIIQISCHWLLLFNSHILTLTSSFSIFILFFSWILCSKRVITMWVNVLCA